MINYIYSNYKVYDLTQNLNNELDNFKNSFLPNILVEKSNSKLDFYIDDIFLKLPLTENEYLNFSFSLSSVEKVSSNTPINTVIGNIDLYLENNFFKTISIKLNSEIIHKTPIEFFEDFLVNFNSIFFYEVKNLF